MSGAANGNGHVHAIRLLIPAKPEYITLGRLALTGIARLRPEPLRQEVLGDLKLALTEACTNSVRHAYAGADGTVEILYELHDDKLVVEVVDEGEGFVRPAALGSTESSSAAPSGATQTGAAQTSATQTSVVGAEELSEGGLGIAIIEALADEFEIRERAQGGSSLRFVKHLS